MNLGWIALLCFVMCCTLTGVICLTAGYTRNVRLNANRVRTSCVVLEHDIDFRECSYSCHCTISCSTCYRECYDGNVLLDVQLDPIVKSWKKVATRRAATDIGAYLNATFPIGSTHECFYRSAEDISFQLLPVRGYLFAGIAFFTIAGVFGLVLGVLFFSERAEMVRHRQIAVVTTDCRSCRQAIPLVRISCGKAEDECERCAAYVEVRRFLNGSETGFAHSFAQQAASYL